MNLKKYLHFSLKERADSLLKKGYIDNTELSAEWRFSWREWVIAVVRDTVPVAVRAFIYDIAKIQQSWYTRTLPFVSEQFIKKKKSWKHLWLFPRYIDVYDIAKFRALIFNVRELVNKNLRDSFMVDDTSWEKIYFETISLCRLHMQDPEEISVQDACEKIIGLKQPFATYRFPEWYDGYENKDLKSQSETVFVWNRDIHLVR